MGAYSRILLPWDSQPQEDSSVDWGGQQAQGLLFANVGSSPVLHANRGSILPSFVGTSLGAVAGGAGYRFTGASTQSVRWDTGITVAGTDALTIEALVWGSSFPSLATIVNLSDVALTNGATAGANGAQRGILSFNSTDPCNIYSWGGSNDYDSTVKFAANSLQHIIITKAAGTGAVQITVHRNGTQIAQGNSSGATPSTTSGPYFYVGGRHPSGSASITGIVLKSAIYSGIISAAQRQSIFANPWQLFTPRSIWVPVSTAGGGSATNLTIQDATHSHTADSLTVSLGYVDLTIADATHAHAADSLTLSIVTVTDLTIADATHAHTADNLTLSVSGATDLVIQDATHGHTADSPTLTLGYVDLVIAEALHGHLADSPTLSVVEYTDLIIAEAVHAHTVDNLTLTFPLGALSDAEFREMYDWVKELHRIHGLTSGVDLVVTPTSRTAGAISQTISEVGTTVTVTRP